MNCAASQAVSFIVHMPGIGMDAGHRDFTTQIEKNSSIGPISEEERFLGLVTARLPLPVDQSPGISAVAVREIHSTTLLIFAF